MKKLTALVLAFVLILSLGATAMAAETPTLTYEEAIAPRFKGAQPFSEGYAAVRDDSYKWGYIDTAGNIVVPCQYDYAWSFNEGYAVVTTFHENEFMEGTGMYRFGVVNASGDYFALNGPYIEVRPTSSVSPSSYDLRVHDGYFVFDSYAFSAEDFIPGTETVEPIELPEEEYSSIVADGFQVTEGLLTACRMSSDGFIYSRLYYNTETGELLETASPAYWDVSVARLRPFNQGLAPAAVYDVDIGKNRWGFIDTNGNWVIEPQFSNFMVSDTATDYVVFGDTGAAIVQDAVTGLWGAIDKSGSTVVPFIYEEFRSYSEGLALVKVGGKYGYMNEAQQLVIPARYNSATSFGEEGYAAVKDDTGTYLIDRSGTAVPGTDKINLSTYVQGTGIPRLFSPGEYVVIVESYLYGYARITGGEADTDTTAYASKQTVSIDGKAVELEAYALKDANGNPTNYVKLRDIAHVLNGTAAQFDVGWDGNVNIITNSPYNSPNGTEMNTPFEGDRTYTVPDSVTKVDGEVTDLAAIYLTDDNGGGYTYYQLRDLGRALDFNVGWSAERGIFIETDRPYTDAD